MPWSTPTLKTVRAMVRDQVAGALATARVSQQTILSALNNAASVGNSVLRVMSDVKSGLAHLVLQYIDWLALQLLPDTAEEEWLDRHGDIWLTNSDGTKGRKAATYASGSVTILGEQGIVVNTGTVFSFNSIDYETTEEVILGVGPSPVHVRALIAGSIGNLPEGTQMGASAAIAGVNPTVTVVEVVGGADQENTEDLRSRVLDRIQKPPMGGDKTDYEEWAKRIPGVTRAWSYPNEMGIGTVTVRFMMDDLRANSQGFPNAIDVAEVRDYLDTVRPVTVKDFFVVALIRHPIDFTIQRLDPDNNATRGAIQVSIQKMLKDKAIPGQTIYHVWKSDAVLDAIGVRSFQLIGVDDVMPNDGEMPVLGNIFYV